LDHVALRLQLKKAPKSTKSKDVEARAEGSYPGEPGFAAHLEKTIDLYHTGKREMLQSWCHRHGINNSEEVFDDKRTIDLSIMDNHAHDIHSRNQRQIYMLLYMEFLVWSCAKAVLNMVKYADGVVDEGTMSKNRLIVPAWKRLKKWMGTFLNAQEGPNEEPRGDLGDLDQAAALVYLGSAFNEKRDPEHLPPRNALEKCGDLIRWIPHILRSDASSFGFRVATATMVSLCPTSCPT
jgi:hypothetical protein